MPSTPRAPGCVTYLTTPIRAFGRSRQVTTAGSAARWLTRSTSPTSATRCGPSGIANSPSAGYRRCINSRAMSGATASVSSTSLTSRRPIDSLAPTSSRHRLGGGRGLPIKRWARRFGRRAGEGCFRRARLVLTVSCSASSSTTRRRCRQRPYVHRVSSPNLPRRQPGCARESFRHFRPERSPVRQSLASAPPKR